MLRLRLFGTVQLMGPERRPLDSVVRGPKRLALLSYLAVARPHGFQRRDRLVALLWPRQDSSHARGSLRSMVHLLRGELGPEAIESRGEEELRVNPEVLRCDVREFDRALEEGDNAAALAVYRGDLLEGFHVSGVAPGFEQWVADERRRLRTRARTAAWELSASGTGLTEAMKWARRAVEIDPLDERAQRRLLNLLVERDGSPSAIRAFNAYAERLRKELGVEPSAEIRELARRLGWQDRKHMK